jgi:hypothetical protein
MTPQQVLDALDLYEDRLKRYGAKTVRANTKSKSHPLDAQVQANHLLWMCGETRKGLEGGEEANVEKAMRWLGFIQGGLWAGGIYSIDDLKNHNR